jgi:hypothetical protein
MWTEAHRSFLVMTSATKKPVLFAELAAPSLIVDNPVAVNGGCFRRFAASCSFLI